MTNFRFALLSFLLFFTFIEISGQVVGRVYEDDCYEDTSQAIHESESILQNGLAAGNDNIHSVNMHSNRHFVRLFKHNNFTGEFRDVYSDMSDLGSIEFHDQTSSLRVFPSETTLPTAGEGVISADILNAKKLQNLHIPGPAGSSFPFILPRDAVNNADKVHVKGLGRDASGTKFVITGCTGESDCSNGTSYILLFEADGTFLHALTLPQGVPSSTQMLGNIFPVAVWNPNGGANGQGATTIRFYTFSDFGLTFSFVVNGSQTISVNERIETLAYANINNRTYLLGTSENAEEISIWEAPFSGAVNGFQNTANGINPDNVIFNQASMDENWPAYRSFWLGKLEEDGRVVLFATHDNWADVWELKNIDNPNNLSLNKIHKKKEGGGWAPNSDRPVLSRGAIPVPGENPNTLLVLAFPDDFENSNAGVGSLGSGLFELIYVDEDCGDIVDCPVPANIAVPSEVCEDEEAWLSIFNTDYSAYKITICTVIPNGCHNTLSTDWQEGQIIQEHRQLESLYVKLANDNVPPHNWKFWCDNTFRVTVELQTECEDPSIAVRDIYKNCGPIVDFEIPSEVCDRDPVILTANNSEHYTAYGIYVCLMKEDECINWIPFGWVEGQIPAGGIDLLAEYEALSNWRFWCDNTYRVTLALRNDCDAWEAERKTFYVNCEPCPEDGGKGGKDRPGDGDGGQFREMVSEEDGIGGNLNVELIGNPVESQATFKLTLEEEEVLSLRLVNIEGKVIKELISQQNYQKGSYMESFDLSQLSDGFYFYQVITKTSMKSGSIIKNESAFSNN